MASVLVVDDDADVLQAFGVVLSGGGHAVVSAASGLDALKVLDDRATQIDLLLTDVVMPGLHGFNLSATIQYVHGYLYLIYLISDFVLITVMRYPITRFLYIYLNKNPQVPCGAGRILAFQLCFC